MSPKLGMESVRRAQVIQATTRCIVDVGLRAVTLQAVADRAGVSKGVVTHYFRNKRDLLLQTFRALLEAYARSVVRLVRPGMKAAEVLDLVVAHALGVPVRPDASGGSWSEPAPDITLRIDDRSVTVSPEVAGKALIHFAPECLLDQAFGDVLREEYRGFEEAVGLVVDFGVQTGEFVGGDRERFSRGLIALVDGLSLHYFLGIREPSGREAMEICRGYLERCLGGGGEHA